MCSYSILVVDDEPNYLIVLSELLRDEDLEVFTAGSGKAGLDICREVDLDLVITDMQMDGMDGMALLEQIKELNPDLPVLIMTAHAEVEKAVKAMQAGAFGYLAKPFANDELLVNIYRAARHYSLIRENKRLRHQLQSEDCFSGIVGKSPSMQRVYKLIRKVAPTPASVLITGESGTGKELVAQAVHSTSPRRDEAFIAVNCAALSANLLESELFGHEKGAFTGAASMRKGRFELAAGGTIFLDEISEIPLELQSKLLRILQEKSFERVGGAKTLHVDVRVISASNKDLKEEVAAGHFREDLFYRLNVIHLNLPPLRERLDDLPLLVAFFIEKYRKILQLENLVVGEEAMKLLLRLPWDGNVRELENTIERAAILCDAGNIMVEDVQPETVYNKEDHWQPGGDLSNFIPESVGLNEVLYAVEERMLIKALDESNQVQARAASQLGITKSLLQYKLKKYGLKKKK
ncbi:sigma-54-dependent transcriptional regulator [Desulfotalea psychrophila]|nr:sigma-54 dependent transcriptional regulator [Desulfotalea psychrophila]